MSNVVSLDQFRKDKGEPEERSVILCPTCQGGWFIVAAVCFEQDGKVSGWHGIPQCRVCGEFLMGFPK